MLTESRKLDMVAPLDSSLISQTKSIRVRLLLEDLDGLRNAVFGDGEVLGAEAVHEAALLVADDHSFDHHLGVDLDGEGAALARSGVRAHLLRG